MLAGYPEQFTTFIRKEQATWKRIIKTGLKIEANRRLRFAAVGEVQPLSASSSGCRWSS